MNIKPALPGRRPKTPYVEQSRQTSFACAAKVRLFANVFTHIGGLSDSHPVFSEK